MWVDYFLAKKDCKWLKWRMDNIGKQYKKRNDMNDCLFLFPNVLMMISLVQGDLFYTRDSKDLRKSSKPSDRFMLSHKSFHWHFAFNPLNVCESNYLSPFTLNTTLFTLWCYIVSFYINWIGIRYEKWNDKVVAISYYPGHGMAT